jgi:hypothetical protein
MIKRNQLVIYPKSAIQHIEIEPLLNQSEIVFPIPNYISPLHIHANHNFTIKEVEGKNHIWFTKYPQPELISTNSIALTEISNHTIEILIKNPHISWKPSYTLMKDSGELICYGCIINETNFTYSTNDIKLVFRSIDHKYKNQSDDRDIPTIDSSNYVEYKLHDQLDESFTLHKSLSVKLWSEKISMKEYVQIDIDNPYETKIFNSFLKFNVPNLMLPGELEIIYRLQNKDILHLGTIYNKTYYKDDELQIMFPRNKSIKIKNKMDTKNHSFFIEKTTCKFESKIKKLYKHPLTVRFTTYKPIKTSSIHFEYNGHYCFWDFDMEDKEKSIAFDFVF